MKSDSTGVLTGAGAAGVSFSISHAPGSVAARFLRERDLRPGRGNRGQVGVSRIDRGIVMRLLGLLFLLVVSPASWADSYRYMHVTIDTPWTIFLFLLVAVLSPFILMAVLYWRYANRRREDLGAGDER